MASTAHSARAGRYGPWLALGVVSLGYFMNVVDSSAVNVALPSIARGLHAGTDQTLWVVNGYLFPFAMLLLLGGRLGDIVGHRNVFFAGLLLFSISSLLCAIAGTPGQLVAGRVLQGIGAAIAAPQALAITTAVFPPERRAMAFGVLASVIGSAAAAAPVLGGVLTDVIGWRSIFYVNLPIGLFGLVAAYLVLPATREGAGRRLPLAASLLASAGVFAVLYSLIEGERYHWGRVWGPVRIPHVLIFGVLLLVGFTFWERANHGGLLPRAIFTSRTYALMVWASAATYFGIFGSQFVMTIYLQSALGVGPLKAGLALAPMWAAASVVAPIAGRLSGRFSPKVLLMAGYLVFSGGIAVAALLAYGRPAWGVFVLPLVIAGAGAGLTFAPLTTLAMREVTPDAVGGASGLIEVVRQAGAAICIAVVGAILQVVWIGSLRAQAALDAASLAAADKAAVRAGVRGLVDRGLTAGGTGSRADVAPGPVGRILHDASVQGLASAAGPALLVTSAVILLAAVATALVRDRTPAELPAEEPARAGRRG
jgi:EmrB/QacA subfamily drug resistance transporter